MMHEFDAEYAVFKNNGKIYGGIEPERIAVLSVPRIAEDIRRRLSAVADVTCELSDALDRLGYEAGRCVVSSKDIFPLKPEYSIVGTALTQRSCPARIHCCDKQQGTEQRKMSTRDIPYLAEAGDVWVIDAKGCECSHFGEIAAVLMREHAIAGTVIDGLIRDCESVKRTGHPFWCRGFTPYSGMYRIETVELNGPITVGNVQVCAGDLVAADANGFCAIPREIIPEIFEELHKHGIC